MSLPHQISLPPEHTKPLHNSVCVKGCSLSLKYSSLFPSFSDKNSYSPFQTCSKCLPLRSKVHFPWDELITLSSLPSCMLSSPHPPPFLPFFLLSFLLGKDDGNYMHKLFPQCLLSSTKAKQMTCWTAVCPLPKMLMGLWKIQNNGS